MTTTTSFDEQQQLQLEFLTEFQALLARYEVTLEVSSTCYSYGGNTTDVDLTFADGSGDFLVNSASGTGFTFDAETTQELLNNLD